MTVNSVISKAKERAAAAYKDISFLDGSPYSMQFAFTAYDYSVVQSGIISQENASGSVTFPLPQALQDSYGVNIGSYELSAVGATVAGLGTGSGKTLDALGDTYNTAIKRFAKLGSEGVDQAYNSYMGNPVDFSVIKEALGPAMSGFSTASSYMGRNLLDEIAPSLGIGAGVAVGRGSAVNPHVALRFEGVDLKTYQFSWSLSPKSRAEADTIRDMIKAIKTEMHPEYTKDTNKTLMAYPSLVMPTLHGISTDHIFHFNVGMISNMTVDYSPDGIALNRGGIPSVINVSFDFTESKINTKSDF